MVRRKYGRGNLRVPSVWNRRCVAQQFFDFKRPLAPSASCASRATARLNHWISGCGLFRSLRFVVQLSCPRTSTIRGFFLYGRIRMAKGRKTERVFSHIIEIVIPPHGLDAQTSREIVDFHRSRNIQVRFGYAIKNVCRWCFSDAATAHAFKEQFSGNYVAKSKKPTAKRTMSKAARPVAGSRA